MSYRPDRAAATGVQAAGRPVLQGHHGARPRRPGRKPGMAYGRHVRRPVPDPDQVSRVVEVGLPEARPHCDGALSIERMACQYQQDLPRCRRPRSAATTSRSAAASSVGGGSSRVALSRPHRRWVRPPSRSAHVRSRWQRGVQGVGPAGGQGRPVAWPARHHHHPGWVTQALARAARRLQPTYAALVGGVQASPVVAPDETGWRVGGQRAWRWAPPRTA
jgi:hypothetical protein